jgi:hypothetical protein
LGRGKNRRKKAKCFNCNATIRIEDNFCSHCGQENNDKKVPIKELARDFTGDYLTVDSKLWKSLKMLIFYPGRMSRDYADGKRMTYIKPIRLYLFISFIYFLALNSGAVDSPVIQFQSSNDNGIEPSISQTSSVFSEDSVDTLKNSLQLTIGNSGFPEGDREKSRNPLVQLISVDPQFQEFARSCFPYVAFLMVPLLALIMFLFFKRKRRYFTEHFVLSLHIHSLMFFVMLISDGVSWLWPGFQLQQLLVLIVILCHSLIAARKMYGSKWWYLSIAGVFTIPFYGLLALSILMLLVVFILSIFPNFIA